MLVANREPKPNPADRGAGRGPQIATMAERILIVEDEKPIADAVAHTLTREGYEARAAFDGESGLHLAEVFKPDLVILDLMLPGIGGLDVCRILRRTSTVPIIMLTAKAAEVDRVVGLEVGADDYITKPFSMRELVARVRAALRRQAMAARPATGATFDDGHLKIDLERPATEVAGRAVALSPRELGLLRVLLAHRGRARTREQLLNEAWGEAEYIDARTVDVHIRWLRKKIERDPGQPEYIETVRGIGYRFGR
jgi:DNA-binding response OmpR family regulator